MSVSLRPLEIAAIAVAATLIGTMIYLLTGAQGLLLANGQPVFGDFIAFWSAGRVALDGHPSLAYEIETARAYQQLAVPGVAYVAPWNSPPTFMLFIAPLAMLPYPVAAVIFLVVTGAIYVYAAFKILPDKRALIFALTMPAAVYHLGTVQSGLLIAGIMALAILWLDKHPIRAAALIALLAIKPHLAIIWPVMLAVTGRWRTFVITSAFMLAFVLIGGFVFGYSTYAQFFDNLTDSQDLISDQRITTPAYASLYANLLAMGSSEGLAIGVHFLSSLAAMGAACWVFVNGARGHQGAALCAATLLFSPYLFFYDFTLLGLAIALLGAPRDRVEMFVAIFAWCAGLSLAVGYYAPLPICPVAAWLVMLTTMRRIRIGARRLSSAPHM